MPVKPTRGGRSRADADARSNPNRPADVDTSLPGHSGARGFDPGVPLEPVPRAGPSGTDAITEPPAVVVHVGSADVHLPAPQLSLNDYVTTPIALLPPVNSEGVRMINGRPYVDLSEGGVDLALVAQDPETGLYRARRPSELFASGPVLLRNPDSGLWRPRAIVEPTTREQVRKYLPEATDQDADGFIARFDDKDVAELELKRIQHGLAQLDSERVSIPYHENHAVKGHEITEAFDMWRRLRQVYSWQGVPDQRVYGDGRLSGFKLDLNLTLWPVDKLLSLKFKSVVSLTLRGYAPLNPEVFFAQFPNIESLTVTSQQITRRGFGTAPDAEDYSRLSVDHRFAEQLAKLPRLRELSLQDCEFQAGFSVRGMTRLQVLRIADTQRAAATGGAGPLRFPVPNRDQIDILQAAVDVTAMSELRVLDLTGSGIRLLPFGLHTNNGSSRLEVLRLGDNPLAIGPSLKTMSALQELDLSNTRLDRFPEGITSQVPRRILNLANNRIASIPETVELRAGFNLSGNPITDPVSLRRLIHARVWTGTDFWLGAESTDHSVDLWLRNLPSNVSAKEITTRRALWDGLGVTDNDILVGMRKLTRTPEFLVEYPLLQGRVWRFLGQYGEADSHERSQLRAIVNNEPSPGKMLDTLEALMQGQDLGQQNQAPHHLPKRPRLE